MHQCLVLSKRSSTKRNDLWRRWSYSQGNPPQSGCPFIADARWTPTQDCPITSVQCQSDVIQVLPEETRNIENGSHTAPWIRAGCRAAPAHGLQAVCFQHSNNSFEIPSVTSARDFKKSSVGGQGPSSPIAPRLHPAAGHQGQAPARSASGRSPLPSQ